MGSISERKKTVMWVFKNTRYEHFYLVQVKMLGFFVQVNREFDLRRKAPWQ